MTIYSESVLETNWSYVSNKSESERKKTENEIVFSNSPRSGLMKNNKKLNLVLM